MQDTALIITSVIVAAVTIAFIWVLSRARSEAPIEHLAPVAYRLRSRLVMFSIVVGALIAGSTLLPWPHDAYATEVTRHIDVKGRQWSWELSDTNIKVGETIEFRVTAEDVNHGFALYDPENAVVAQIQAMPGFTNKARYRFEQPGTYRILCLEYCGLVHHGMTAELTVTQAASN